MPDQIRVYEMSDIETLIRNDMAQEGYTAAESGSSAYVWIDGNRHYGSDVEIGISFSSYTEPSPTAEPQLMPDLP